MDDNVKNNDGGSVGSNPNKNNRNRNRSRSRNNYKKNYQNKNDITESNAVSQSESKSPNARPNNDERRKNYGGDAYANENAGNPNRNDSRSRNNNRKNNNKNKGGNYRDSRSGSKSKPYYMSMKSDDDEFDKVFAGVFDSDSSEDEVNFSGEYNRETNNSRYGNKNRKRKPYSENADTESVTNKEEAVQKPSNAEGTAEAYERNVTKKATKPKKTAEKAAETVSAEPIGKQSTKPKKTAEKAAETVSAEPIGKQSTKPKRMAEKGAETASAEPNAKQLTKPKKTAKKADSFNPNDSSVKKSAKKKNSDERNFPEANEKLSGDSEKHSSGKTEKHTKKNLSGSGIDVSVRSAMAAANRSEQDAQSRAGKSGSVRGTAGKSSAKNVNPVRNEADTAENRKKSETRFWARFFSLLVIVPVYAAIVICMLVMPRSTVSAIEKRTLDTFPKFSWKDYWSGTYTSAITHYFDDTVPHRDSLKQAASQMMNFLGIKYNNVQVSGQMQVVNVSENVVDSDTESKTTSSKKPPKNAVIKSNDYDTDSESNTPKGQEIADGVYANGIIVVFQDKHFRGMSMYGGGSGDVYASAVNNFAADLPGVNVYSMVAPTSSEYYTPLNFQDYNASQEDDIKDINSKLQNVTGINICPVLAKHVKENIYTRTDHHWTALGAYYAAQEFCKTAGVPFKELKDYEKKSVPGYVGTLYTFSGNNADLLNDPEDFIYYVPKAKNYSVEYYDYGYNFQFEGDLFVEAYDISEMYSSFIGGDSFTVKISTGVKNGRKLCFVKDSYGDAIPPFLTGSFEEIYCVDMRYFEPNLVDFIKEKGVTDLLFSCCSYSAVGPNADSLEGLRASGSAFIGDDDSSSEEEDEESSVSSEITDDNSDETEDMNNDKDYSDDSTTVTTTTNGDDEFFENLEIEDGQLGLVGNINDNADNGDNGGGDDYGEDNDNGGYDDYDEDY